MPMNRSNLHKNNMRKSRQQDKSKESQKSRWVEEIIKSFNKNRNKRIAVA
jgi:hypothetical protein